MLKLIGLVLAWVGFRKLQPAFVPVRRVSCLVATLGLASMASIAAAQVSDNQLKLMGLQSMWQAQLDLPLEAGEIVSAHLWTNPNDKKVYAELTLPVGLGVSNRTLRTAATLAEDGTTWQIDAAKKDVEIRAARILGRSAGTPAVEVSVPLVYLVVVTSDGVVQTYDAETGEKLWQTTCGPLKHPAAPASVGDIGIVIAQGDTLYLLDWKTGEHLQRRKMERATSTGVALVGTLAFTASRSGQIQGFDLAKPKNAPFTFRLLGRAVGVPATSDRTHHLAAFASIDGRATLFSAADKIGPWFNVQARESLTGPLTFIGGALYVADSGGQLSKIALDRTGKVEWRMMIGDPLGAPPMVIGKTVYAANEVGLLHAADDTNGYPLWPVPTQRIKAILAGNKDRLYCRSLTDRLLVVDAQNGNILNQTGESRIGYTLVNHLNDRLYIFSSGGQMQCAREFGSEHVMPSFHEPLPVATEENKPNNPAEAPAADEPAATTTEENPFGAESMEPATGDAPAADNPFGASDANPF